MKKPKLSSTLIILALFLFFLFISFPFENLKGWIFSEIYNRTRILIVADEMALSFLGWPGASLKNVNVTLPIGENELELASEKLFFRVGLAGLFPPAPSVSMNIKKLKKGGDIYTKFSQGREIFSVKLEASNVNLEQMTLPGFSHPLKGNIKSDSDLRVNKTNLSKSLGRLEIKGDGIHTPSHTVQGLPGMSFSIPGLKIGKFESIVALKNGTAELTSIKFGEPGSDLNGTITGEVKLGQDLPRSQLNLVVRFQLAPSIMQDPQNKTFVSFLEGYQLKPGEFGMKWNASFAELSGLSIKLIPDKLTQ